MTFTHRPCVKGQTRTRWCLVLCTQNSAHIAIGQSAFTLKEKKFICIEQGYMYNKAVIHGDFVPAQKISCITNPREIKRLGAAITVSDCQQWDAIKGKLMLELVRANYTQMRA